MVNGFFRYAKRDRLFGRRRNMREDPTIRSRKGGRAAKAVLRILLVLLNLLITAVAAESTATAPFTGCWRSLCWHACAPPSSGR